MVSRGEYYSNYLSTAELLDTASTSSKYDESRKIFFFLIPSPGDPSARVFEVFLIVLDGVQGETLWWGGSRARNHNHKRERKAGQSAVKRTTVQR